MRKCNKCGQKKPATDKFYRPYKNKNGDLRSHKICRKCEAAYTRHYCNTNKTWRRPHVQAYQKKYKEDHRNEIRDSVYRNRFGITLKEVEAMAENQNNGCAICQNPIDWEDKHSCHVDHCHSIGKVRGILCAKCNRGIGHFNDSAQLLKRAACYVSGPNQ